MILFFCSVGDFIILVFIIEGKFSVFIIVKVIFV